MHDLPTFRIDGAAFSDLEGFFDEIESQLLGGVPWERTLDGLESLLDGRVPGVPGAFRLIWEHSDLSRRRLGSDGAGSFGELIERIVEHPNVELVLS